ncbi:MAG: hypothetical protein RL134_2556 [Actinomycetota bacterium]
MSIPGPDPDMERVLRALGIPDGDSLHDLVVAAERMSETVGAIDALHQPSTRPWDITHCTACFLRWPCPTNRLIHPSDEAPEVEL